VQISTYVRFEVFTAVTVKNAILWDVMLRGSCENQCFGGGIASIIWVNRISKQGTVLAVTNNRRMIFANNRRMIFCTAVHKHIFLALSQNF
jgi:hypothetical protein